MIRQLTDGRLFAQLDSRGRLSLGKHATATAYWVTQLPNGNIIMDPDDHSKRCCTEHGTHSMPHVGCVLR